MDHLLFRDVIQNKLIKKGGGEHLLRQDLFFHADSVNNPNPSVCRFKQILMEILIDLFFQQLHYKKK